MSPDPAFIAIIPAAGKGSRLGCLPVSKELIPLEPARNGDFRPLPGSRVVIEETLWRLGAGGITEAVIVSAPGKEDIRAYLGDGPVGGVRLRYAAIADSPGVPHTLAHALPQLAGRNVLLAFPDILVEPADVPGRLVAAHDGRPRRITLAAVPSDRGDKVDLVDADAGGRVTRIRPKPGPGHAGWTWVAAAWGPEFSAFLGDFAASHDAGAASERYVGDVINAALDADFIVQMIKFEAGSALDIGTPNDLARLWAEKRPDRG